MDWTFWGRPKDDDSTFEPMPEHYIDGVEKMFKARTDQLSGRQRWAQRKADQMIIRKLRKGESFYSATIDVIAAVSWWSGVVSAFAVCVMALIYYVSVIWFSAHLPWWLYFPGLIGFWFLIGRFTRPKKTTKKPENTCPHTDLEEIVQGEQRSIRCRDCGSVI